MQNNQENNSKNPNVQQQPLENLDCSGAGVCQPEPIETTDTYQREVCVQKQMARNSKKKK